MRKVMFCTMHEIIQKNEQAFFLMVDIGAFSCKEMLREYPDRVKNIGIFEDGIVGIASGLAYAGFVPFIYGISPFLINRANEQLKLDFAYQSFGGNFISTGASYDFSTLGFSHYCPEDVIYLRNIPSFEICTPSTPSQLQKLLGTCWNDGLPTYYRMTDFCSKYDCEIQFGKANVVKKSKDSNLTVISFAETIDKVLMATENIDVTILYYSTVIPFDYDTLKMNSSSKILIVSPFYKGFITDLVLETLEDRYLLVKEIGVPHEILRNYGKKDENDVFCGITVDEIKSTIIKMQTFGGL